MIKDTNKNLTQQIQNLPKKPGVYLFKNEQNLTLYVGKAKNLKSRVSNYLSSNDFKSCLLRETSICLDFILTSNELEAMLLEAKLIQTYQPKFNTLLKSGQPFLYLMISTNSLPELKIVRNKKQKGIYFGPFLEKAPARKTYDFLIKTLRLKLCKKKIENGCLEYHMGICAGVCTSNFDKNEYLERLELAKKVLKNDHDEFLDYLNQLIKKHNFKLEFEKSQKLNEFYQALQKTFKTLDTKLDVQLDLDQKDIWFITQDQTTLFFFKEKNGVLKKKEVFYLLFPQDNFKQPDYLTYFESYYRTYPSPAIILTNFDLDKNSKKLYENFIQNWHKKNLAVSIIKPKEGHFSNLIKLAKVHVELELKKQVRVSLTLKKLLKLSNEPHTIDCFDISHKQGKFMVGSCVRFFEGRPDKKKFRHFYIKTLTQQNDYAALQEIIKRRYKNLKDLPDLILIDGGKGQLNTTYKLFPKTEFISLAKKEEKIFSIKIPEGKRLNLKKFEDQLLIAIRDYAHHFAIKFHQKVEQKKLFNSI